jgi:hypothetical protein
MLTTVSTAIRKPSETRTIWVVVTAGP